MAEVRAILATSTWNIPAERFSLYGICFRWVRSATHQDEHDPTTVSLVQECGGFPVNDVSWLTRGNTGTPSFGIIGEYYAYRYKGVADFLLLRSGTVLRAFILPEADPWLLSFILFRGIAPRLLHLRGLPCLHASAVFNGHVVIGFLGLSGYGKSTLAAALVARGFRLVSDDILPLRSIVGHGIVAGPGLPEIRLYRSAAELTGVAAYLSPPGPGQTKGRWNPRTEQITLTAAPLAQLYLLHPYHRSYEHNQGAYAGSPLTQSQAFIALVENSFWLHPGETSALASDMACFADVVRSIPIRPLLFEPTPLGFAAVEALIRS